jgi:hypothetical protein
MGDNVPGFAAPGISDQSRKTSGVDAGDHGVAFWILGGTALLAVLLAALLLQRNFSGGTWFDEYATLWFSDPAIDLQTLYRDRWVSETNPWLYYLFMWLMRRWTGADLLVLRGINIVFFASCMVYLLWTAARQPRSRSFCLTVAILFLSSGDQLLFFPELRSYYWQISWMFMFCVSLARILDTTASDRLNRVDCAVNLATLFVLTNVHFTSALLTGLLSGSAIVFAALRRDWRLVRFLLFSVMACTAIAAAFVLVRLGNLSQQYQEFWIATAMSQAFADIWDVCRGALCKNVVLLALLAAAVVYRIRSTRIASAKPAPDVTVTPASLALVYLAGVLAFFALMLLLNVHRPIIINRYIAVAGPALAIAMSLCVAPLLKRWPVLLVPLFANGVAVCGLMAMQPVQQKETDPARMMAQIYASCPDARIVGLIDDYPRPFRETGYRYLSERFDVPIQLVRVDLPWSPPRSATCPTVLWWSHLTGLFESVPVTQIVTASQLIRVMRLNLSKPDVAQAEIHLFKAASPILILPPDRSLHESNQ